MAALDDDEIGRILERHDLEYQHAGFTTTGLISAVRQTRRAGYAKIVSTITQGVSGVERTFSASPSVIAAISFGAISSRLEEPRRHEMGQLLIENLPPRHELSVQVSDIAGE
jgi:DNA-binding IclR family transcriptional regulator